MYLVHKNYFELAYLVFFYQCYFAIFSHDRLNFTVPPPPYWLTNFTSFSSQPIDEFRIFSAINLRISLFFLTINCCISQLFPATHWRISLFFPTIEWWFSYFFPPPFDEFCDILFLSIGEFREGLLWPIDKTRGFFPYSRWLNFVDFPRWPIDNF